MEYSPIKFKEKMEKHNFNLKKMFGQNFIIDENVINNIITKSQIDRDTLVIEIGPGAGSLTYALAKYAKNVLCYEIDGTLKELLEENLSEYNNVEIKFQDFLKSNVIEDIKNYNYNKYLFENNIVKYFRFINNMDMDDYQLYIDYMRMCKNNKLYPYGKFPKQIKSAHDMMVLYNAERLEAARANNFKEAIKTDLYNNLIHKTEKFEFLIPRSADDLVNESYQMRNCVRSYINSVANGHTYIVFMRKKEKLSKSFVTIEVSKNYRLGQVKGVGNSKVDRITAEAVIEWCDQKSIDYRYNWDLDKALDNAA